MLPYDYHVLWTTPADRAPYFNAQETHLRTLHASPPLIGRILNLVVGTGLLGFIIKLGWKPTEANMLFDGASLVLYMCGVTVYLANIVKGLRTATAGAYGPSSRAAAADGVAGAPADNVAQTGALGADDEMLSREDSLRVMAASNTILALVLVGVLVLQAGQWYAVRKEEKEIADIRRKKVEERKAGGSGSGSGVAKKKNA